MRRLNLGCGSNYHPECVNVDRYRESPHHKDACTFDVRADAHHLPFADGAFEYIRFRHVLEHLERPLAALRECRRVLAAGGECYVEVPYPPVVGDERSRHHRMHIYSWTPGSLERICERAGFASVEYHDHDEHPEAMWGGHAVTARA